MFYVVKRSFVKEIGCNKDTDVTLNKSDHLIYTYYFPNLKYLPSTTCHVLYSPTLH